LSDASQRSGVPVTNAADGDRRLFDSAPAAVRLFGLAALVLALVFGILTWLVVVYPDAVTEVDMSIDSTVHSAAVANWWMVDVSLVLRFVGGGVFSGTVMAVVVIGLLMAGRIRRPFDVRTYAAAFLALSAVGGALANTVVKSLVDRSRPPWNGLWSYEPTSSYPSAHAQGGITVWIALALVVLVTVPGRLRWVISIPLLILGPAIGMSRTVLGVHWPSDVLGGWSLGGAWMAASAAIIILIAADSARLRRDSTDPAV
jgi:membrane-associated phospholipid phosphatase